MKIPMMNKCVYCYFTLLTILVRLIKSVGAFRGSLTGAGFFARGGSSMNRGLVLEKLYVFVGLLKFILNLSEE